MNISEFLAIYSTQSYINFDQFITWRGLFKDPEDFRRNYDQVIDDEERLKIKSLSIFDRVDRIFLDCINHKSQILHPYHPDYPDTFLNLKRPPLFLNIKGRLLSSYNAFSVVGSREPSLRVVDWMQTYLPNVIKNGYGIVSGAARGVDQEAHKICLRAGQSTIAFLPSGLRSVYPRDFIKYEDHILSMGGALISEYEPRREVMPHHFSERNRMIAMLGSLVLVCEAKIRSGSFMTARLAIENCKTLCVLPSFPTDTKNAGGLNLLFEGAFPIRDDKDLLTLLAVSNLNSTNVTYSKLL